MPRCRNQFESHAFNRYLFAIFTDTPELIELAGQMMRIMAVGYIAISITQVLGGVMRGAGDTVTPMWISIFTTIIIRVPAAYLIAHLTASSRWPHGTPWALSGSLLIAWTLGAVAQALAFTPSSRIRLAGISPLRT